MLVEICVKMKIFHLLAVDNMTYLELLYIKGLQLTQDIISHTQIEMIHGICSTMKTTRFAQLRKHYLVLHTFSSIDNAENLYFLI